MRTTVWHAHHVLPHRRSAQVAANLQKLAMKPETRRADSCCAGVAAAAGNASAWALHAPDVGRGILVRVRRHAQDPPSVPVMARRLDASSMRMQGDADLK